MACAPSRSARRRSSPRGNAGPSSWEGRHDPRQLDDDPGTRPFRHILLGQNAAWHSVNDELPKLEGLPPPEQRLRRRD
jgi:hypothetical protein